jgi:hypothetical protein
MKTILLLVASILICGTMAMAQQTGTLTLQWDQMPAGQTWSEVRAYEQVGCTGTTYNKVATAPMPATTVQVTGVAPGPPCRCKQHLGDIRLRLL